MPKLDNATTKSSNGFDLGLHLCILSLWNAATVHKEFNSFLNAIMIAMEKITSIKGEATC